MGRIAEVFFDGEQAGVLTETDDNRYRFEYDRQYVAHGAPLAFLLPLQIEAFESDTLFPFFDNLASEGWMKNVQSTSMKIDERDTFGLLLHNGADLVGAVTIKEVTL